MGCLPSAVFHSSEMRLWSQAAQLQQGPGERGKHPPLVDECDEYYLSSKCWDDTVDGRNPKQPPGKSFGTNCLSTGAGFFPSPVFRMGIIRMGRFHCVRGDGRSLPFRQV